MHGWFGYCLVYKTIIDTTLQRQLPVKNDLGNYFISVTI